MNFKALDGLAPLIAKRSVSRFRCCERAYQLDARIARGVEPGVKVIVYPSDSIGYGKRVDVIRSD